MKNIDYDIPIFESNDLADLDLYSEKMATAIKGQIDKITTNVDGKVTEIQDNIEEINKKDTEQDNKIVELQNEKIELEKELKEIQEDFYQSSIRGQASGEYIHVEDSSNCRARIGISGNHEQETREGYNQFKTNTSSRTVNGVTVTKNNDSSISFSGTTTAGFTVQLVNYNDLEVTKKMYLRNYGTLENANFIVQLIRSGKTSVEYVPIRPDVTLNAGDIIQKIYVQQQLTGKTVSGTLDILLTDYENKDKGYEQYGAMPSPDYPSEIKTVGDNVNLLDVSKIGVRTSYGITFTQTDTGIKITGTATDTYAYGTSIKIDFKKGKTYTLYGKNAGNAFKLELKKAGTNVMTIKTSGDKVTFTSKEDIDSITFVLEGISKGTTYNYEISNIKIVEGTEVGGYSKYGMGSTKITKCNKNRVGDIQKGYWNNTGVFEYDTNFVSSKQIKVEKGKTYIGGLFDKNKNYVGKTAYVLFDKNKNFIRYSGEETITIGDNEEYVSIRTYSAQASYITSNNYLLQLEVGNKTSSYEEHQEQSYIIPTQQEMLEGDYFDWDNEEEVHVWKKRILDGKEAWIKTQDKEGFYINTGTFNELSNSPIVSDKFIGYQSHNDYYDKSNAIGWIYSNIHQLYIKIKDINTVEELKAYLSNNNVTIYYKLSTPIRLPFIEEQKEIAKELNNARTYKNVTNIYSTDEVSPIIELDYAKDLETLINNVQALALSNVNEEV